METPQHNCPCHDSISPKAHLVIRTSHSQLSSDTQALADHYKNRLAALYSDIENLSPSPQSITSAQDIDRYTTAAESTYEALRHIQLAAYYITHALTTP